jgi:type IV pilus assembly protein PilM
MLLGVDIGSFALKVCSLVKTRKGPALEAFGAVSWPERVWEEGIFQHPDIASQMLRELLKQMNIKQKKVAVAVSGPDTFVRRMQIPLVKNQEILSAIQFEAEQWMPFELSSSHADYKVIHTDGKKMDVVLAACRPHALEGIKNIVAKAGLQLKVVDISCLAVANFLDLATQKFGSGFDSVIVVDVGGSAMRISLIYQGCLSYVREVPTAGIYLTQEVSRRLGLSLYEAEVLKQGGDKDHVIPRDVVELMMLLLDNLAGEAKRSVEFFQRMQPQAVFNKILITGGSARIPELARVLQESLKKEVIALDPTLYLPVRGKYPEDYLKQMAAVMPTAIGLALRDTKD